ncbi:MAG: DUF3048 domain-containing protein [Lachnospiraceae bacterium]|nr:DUF3048 domain-containing protein [Lachnospiraceae bacterium]
MKRLFVLFLAAILAFSLFGCKKASSKTANNNAKKKNSQSAVAGGVSGGGGGAATSSAHSGEVRSFLSGEWVSKDIGSKRPAAVMITNQPEAAQPSGLSYAKIVYEAPAEGNYSTRLMGLFENYEGIPKIGSVRSCRNAYVYFALEHDAIYVHAGQSMPALELVSSDFVDNISTMDKGFNEVFFQTSDLAAPHNTFTSGAGILAGANSRGYSLDHSTEYKGPFKFNENDNEKITLTEGVAANYVYPGYSICNPYFVYNKDDGKYYRFQYKKGQLQQHMDLETNQQLNVDNIIFQYCDFSKYLWEGEETLYWDIGLKGSGKGTYITGGKAVDITWKKTSEFGTTHYYDAKGKELTINRGKTWVCLINNDNAGAAIISANDEAANNQPSDNSAGNSGGETEY